MSQEISKPQIHLIFFFFFFIIIIVGLKLMIRPLAHMGADDALNTLNLPLT